jgi:hypothetical protein
MDRGASGQQYLALDAEEVIRSFCTEGNEGNKGFGDFPGRWKR